MVDYNNIDLSICIPVYNGENTIETAINSALCISGCSFEILISDNCSEDNTKKIINHFTKINKGVVIGHFNKENLGFARNFKKCIELARGKYIFFIGADDYLMAKNINLLVEYLNKNNNVSIVTSNFVLFKKDYNEITRKAIYLNNKEKRFSKGEDALVNWLFYATLGSIGGYLFRKVAIISVLSKIPDETIVPQMYLGGILATNYDVAHVPFFTFAQRLSDDTTQLANRQYQSLDVVHDIFDLIHSISMKVNNKFLERTLVRQHCSGIINNIISYRVFGSFTVFIKLQKIILMENGLIRSILNIKYIAFVFASILIPKEVLKKLLQYFRNSKEGCFKKLLELIIAKE
ncbi:MAG: glycosyltransferase family 2 protein [Flavobacteriales bacterium]|nr:glycosyltransferase family 2 protein [Leptospiraceae bacterium]MCB9336298.1 glycosyltransferase family 2 protein [Flavobacteriales bacterium]